MAGQASHAARAINDFELMQAVGGWLDFQALPLTRKQEFFLVLRARQEAEAQQVKDAQAEAKRAGDAGARTPGHNGWRGVNRTARGDAD